MRAFRKLLAAGHSLVIIEHNMDVVSASDWLIDLGPEGGDAGGEVVAVGTPDEVIRHERSHTGRELKAYRAALAHQGPRVNEAAASYGAQATAADQDVGRAMERAAGRAPDSILIVNAREHNLKSI